MEKTGYILIGIVAIIWIFAIIFGLVAAFPFGLIGLIGITGVGFLFAKVIKDRIENKEDDYYDKNVNK